LTLQNVTAQVVTSKPTKTYVQNVPINVSLVNYKKKTVLNVLKTESILHYVPVQMDIITLKDKPTVQLVTKNVKLVFLLLTTVSLVLKD